MRSAFHTLSRRSSPLLPLLQYSPHQPAPHGPVWPPDLGILLQLLRRDLLPPAVHPAEAVPEAGTVQGRDFGAAKPEMEGDVDGPLADARAGGEAGNNRLVAQLPQVVGVRKNPLEGLFGEVLH